jgi:hypothetical protein
MDIRLGAVKYPAMYRYCVAGRVGDGVHDCGVQMMERWSLSRSQVQQLREISQRLLLEAKHCSATFEAARQEGKEVLLIVTNVS